IRARQGRRDRIRSAKQVVNGPWLTAHFGRSPSRHRGNEAERSHDLACAEEPARFEEASFKPQPPARYNKAKHNDADSYHDAEGEERDRDRRAIPWWPILQALDHRVG